jgi:hypothetical protein
MTIKFASTSILAALFAARGVLGQSVYPTCSTDMQLHTYSTWQNDLAAGASFVCNSQWQESWYYNTWTAGNFYFMVTGGYTDNCYADCSVS